MKNHIEMERSYITEAAFKAQIRNTLKKNGLETWASYITKELGHTRTTTKMGDWNETEDYTEFYKEVEGEFQMYLRPTEKGIENGFTGYNFNYEFHMEDDKVGHGYFFVVNSMVEY